ncbi:MAG: hypothetical protein JO165_04415, partial [Candidatus Eremiobacteraeota bacterium]|nr:hypothetical protein [Candidatus Eremiobacteraeota bacterium]
MNIIGLALHIPAIGAAQLAGGVLTGKANGVRGLIKDIRFGDTLSNTLQTATGGFDAASQLAALLQGGIPVANIANQIATSLTDGIVRATNGTMSKDMQQQLQRALANALAPPGSNQTAQTLMQRLRSTIATMTREADTDAGQQSRFSGDVLDAAKTAREIPALQTKNASLIDSIVADAIARLQTAATSSSFTPANQSAPQQALDGAATALTAAQAPAQQASDIIGRMIARALGVDAQRQQASPVVSATTAHSAVVQNANGTPNVTPSVLFQR